jgi:meiotically up-regulated gene 157 (Mug157) protein
MTKVELFYSFDGREFTSEEACAEYESLSGTTISIPVSLLREVFAQMTPYGVKAKERWEVRRILRNVVEVQAPELMEHFPVEAPKPIRVTADPATDNGDEAA